MTNMTRQLHINLFISGRGHHEASWRHPDSSPLALTDIRYFQELAKRAEEGLFDSIFMGDHLAIRNDVARTARTWAVTSSPRVPSPRVTARASTPRSAGDRPLNSADRLLCRRPLPLATKNVPRSCRGDRKRSRHGPE